MLTYQVENFSFTPQVIETTDKISSKTIFSKIGMGESLVTPKEL